MSTEEIIVAPFHLNDLAPTDFDNEVWQRCTPVQITRQWSGDESPLHRHAEARVCWTNSALHVRFIGNQGEPLTLATDPVTDRKTLGLWDRDVCEIFLAPDISNPDHYYEFEAAPTGEWVDLGIQIKPTGRETDWDYSSGMTTAARIEPTRITVALRIPWSETLKKPEVGAVWRANVFRCVSLDPITRYLAWRPTYTAEPNFHVPAAFGLLEFV